MKSAQVSVQFKTTLYALKDWTILPVPKPQSLQLGSRGQISVMGKLNGHEFQTVLEPDGRWSHWIRVTKQLQQQAGVKAGDNVTVELIQQATWPEPSISKDVREALSISPKKVKHKWENITPMARWEWIRWIDATPSRDTRNIRIEKTIAKLNGTHRRPCCFNLAACTNSYVAKNGRLIEVDT